MRSRYLTDLTTPELEEYLENNSSIAILPVGSVEMHGPHQPIGTDTLVAKAFALKMAETANGLVLPEVNYSWTGASDGFKGTISVETDLEQALIEAITVRSFDMGFKSVIIISIHGPNDKIIYLCARRIFEKYHKPVLFINPTVPFNKKSAEAFTGEYSKSKEASLVLAALDILGRPGLYPEADMCYEDSAPAFSPELLRLNRVACGIGYFMQDIRQHVCPSKYISLEKGLEFFESQLENVQSIIRDLEAYTTEASLQKNRGYCP